MKWFAGTIAGVFLGLIGLSLFLAFRAGAFLPVEISHEKAQNMGPYTLLYKDVVGPYHKVSEDLFEVESLSKKHGLICTKTFGHYLDDPQKVDHERLRSQVGCVFPSKQTGLAEKLNKILEQEPKYQKQNLELTNYVQGQFQGSPALVAFKVYPKLTNLAQQKRLKLSVDVYEIYQAHGSKKMTTQVIIPVE